MRKTIQLEKNTIREWILAKKRSLRLWFSLEKKVYENIVLWLPSSSHATKSIEN